MVPALSLRSREFCGGIIGDDAQIVHLLYKIVIFGGYILHPLHPLHIRYAHLKPSIFWRLGVGEDQSFFS